MLLRQPALTPPWVALSDPDVRTYVQAVEAADGARLELPVRKALHEFVVGCKADGIWSAIKASCILAGARTLSGALVPLVGAAPTNNNFVSGDYSRKTGLVGDASTKYLNANIAHNANSYQNNAHVSVWCSTVVESGRNAIGVYSSSGNSYTILGRVGGSNVLQVTGSGSSVPAVGTGSLTGLVGATRNSNTTMSRRYAQTTDSTSRTSTAPDSENFFVFATNESGPTSRTNARLAFYSIGESLDLAALDNRVTTLVNTLAAVLP